MPIDRCSYTFLVQQYAGDYVGITLLDRESAYTYEDPPKYCSYSISKMASCTDQKILTKREGPKAMSQPGPLPASPHSSC